MNAINRQIASVAGKLTRAFFLANPETERTLSEVQREMRQKAKMQVEAELQNAIAEETAPATIGEQPKTDSPVADFETVVAAIETMQGNKEVFMQWWETAKNVVVMSRKKDGAKVVAAKPAPKWETLINVTFDNGKKGIVMSTAKELKRLYIFTAK